MDEFVLGNKPRLQLTVTDADGTAVDPTAVQLEVQDPSGNVATLTYADSEVTKDDTGIYYYDQDLDEAGIWLWRWEGTGENQCATQGKFRVVAALI